MSCYFFHVLTVNLQFFLKFVQGTACLVYEGSYIYCWEIFRKNVANVEV